MCFFDDSGNYMIIIKYLSYDETIPCAYKTIIKYTLALIKYLLMSYIIGQSDWCHPIIGGINYHSVSQTHYLSLTHKTNTLILTVHQPMPACFKSYFTN